LHDLNLEELIKNIDYTLLENLKNSLEPFQLAVENLSRIDATLYSADVVINFMKTKVTIHPDFGGTVLIFSKLSLVPI
jgi:hypothetical protein